MYGIKYAFLRLCSGIQPTAFSIVQLDVMWYAGMNGGDPHRRMYKITPALQTSISFP
jgi:hypothetical protein